MPGALAARLSSSRALSKRGALRSITHPNMATSSIWPRLGRGQKNPGATFRIFLTAFHGFSGPLRFKQLHSHIKSAGLYKTETSTAARFCASTTPSVSSGADNHFTGSVRQCGHRQGQGTRNSSEIPPWALLLLLARPLRKQASSLKRATHSQGWDAKSPA